MRIFKSSLCVVALLALSMMLFGCSSIDNSDVTIGCIDYVPFTSLDGEGNIVGVEADMVREAASRFDVKPEMKMYDTWTDCYAEILNGGMDAAITVTYTPTRADLFKWAGPVNRVPFWILSTKDAGLDFRTMEAAMQLDSIGVVKGWAEMERLEELGFKNLVYCDTLQEVVRKAVDGEVQAFAHPIPMKGMEFTDGKKEVPLSEINRHFAYYVAYYYMAFSKDVPDAVVDHYQSAIDQMLLDGTATMIKSQYVKVNLEPYGKIQLFTESNPPYNFLRPVERGVHGEPQPYDGSSIDIVNAIQHELGVKNPIVPPPWHVGYSIVQYLPYSAIFSTVRTPEREDMFQWVGPIAVSESVCCTLKKSGIKLKSTEDLRKYKIAVLRDSSDEIILKEKGIAYEACADVEAAFAMFASGKADVTILNKLTLANMIQSHELSMSDVETIRFTEPRPMYIAFSKATPEYVVANWQHALDKIRESGKLQLIWNHWYPAVPLPEAE